MNIVDYELLIGNTFWYVDAETFSIYKGVCKVVTIKIYADEENITQTTILYLLDIGDSGTIYVDNALAFDTYAEAATYLGTLYDPDEVITP